MTAKLKIRAAFTPDMFADLWQQESRKEAPEHNRRPISCQIVSVWIFFLVVMKILLLTCQRHIIPMWGWSEQSLPPLLAPEASSRLSNNGILAIVYPNYRTTWSESSMSGKIGNRLTAISCILERVLYYIIHDNLKVWWVHQTHQDRGKKYKYLFHLSVPGHG